MDDRLTELSTRDLIERLATSEPIPGGGSASALAGAMAAALVQMVVALTTGRPAASAHEDVLGAIAAAARAGQSDLLRLTEADAAAYDAVVRARRLPRDAEAERAERAIRIAAATREATLAPLETARIGAEILGLAERLVPIANRNAISDVGVAALLAATAVRGAALNVQINLPYLAADDALRDEAPLALSQLLEGLDGRAEAIRHGVEERLG